MKNQFFQLCNIIRNTSASVNFGGRLVVVLTIFNGSENEDVFCLLDKFKRAAKLNGSNKDDLPIIGQMFDLRKHEHWDLDNTSICHSYTTSKLCSESTTLDQNSKKPDSL